MKYESTNKINIPKIVKNYIYYKLEKTLTNNIYYKNKFAAIIFSSFQENQKYQSNEHKITDDFNLKLIFIFHHLCY